MEKSQTKPADAQTAARTVTTNTNQPDKDIAPPVVPSAPSPDTRGSTGTSTAEGPSRPQAPVPDAKAASVQHGGGDGKREVSPPGERVDDEATQGKVLRRQE